MLHGASSFKTSTITVRKLGLLNIQEMIGSILTFYLLLVCQELTKFRKQYNSVLSAPPQVVLQTVDEFSRWANFSSCDSIVYATENRA